MAAAPQSAKTRIVSKEELAQHKTKKDCWIALHEKVYDVSNFHDKHPGEGINDQYIAMYAGTDVTVQCTTMHASKLLTNCIPKDLFEKYHSTDEPFEWLEKAENGEFPQIVWIGRLAK